VSGGSRPQRILRIITRLNAGGPARHVIWVEKGLQSRGYQTALLAGRVEGEEDDLSSLAADEGIPVREIPRLVREIRPAADIASVGVVAGIIRHFDPDVVHTHTAKAGLVGRVATSLVNRFRLGRRRIRAVHTFHGNVLSGYFSRPKECAFRGLERILGHAATDAVLVLSPQQRSEIVGRFRVAPAGKVWIVPLALDLSTFETLPASGSLRSELGLDRKSFLVGMIGRVTPVKDHPLFLQAAAIVAAREPQARFVVVGGGEEEAHLHRLVAQLGIAERVFFLGMRKDLARIYADLDAVALTSRNEGTPLSLIEAMAAGRPIVATDVGGVRDILTTEWEGRVRERRFIRSPEPRGIVVSERSAERIAASLLRLAREPRLSRALGEAGRRYAHRFHTLPRLLDDLEEVYSAVQLPELDLSHLDR
jgi:glycosyltransferase involved in cell wall biosynthesis